MSGFGTEMVVMGIDPGLHSLGICVLTSDHISSVLQIETPPKERGEDECKRWLRIITNAVSDARPKVVGLEDIDNQPWKAGGRYPKGIMKMQRLVQDVREAMYLQGVTLYMQSPDIQGGYPDAVVDAMIHKAMGADYEIKPHLRSATKHALEASTMYKKARYPNGE
jgi:hypothetical protein